MASDDITRQLRRAEYLQQYFADTGRKYATGKNIKCPNAAAHAHGDANASARVYENDNGALVKCYGCGGSWDIFALWQMDNGGTFAEAKAALCERFDIARTSGETNASRAAHTSGGNVAEVRALEGSPVAEIGTAHGAAVAIKPDRQTAEYICKCALNFQAGADGEAGRAYMAGRGVSVDTARRFNVGYDATRQTVIIPQGAGYMARSTKPDAEQKDKCRYYPKGAPRVLFNGANMARAAKDGNPVFIVEGEMDALSFAEVGAMAVSTGGTSGIGKAVRAAAQIGHGVYVPCMDRDEQGEKAQAALVAKLRAIGGAVYVYVDAPQFLLPDTADGTHPKDANEALQKDAAAFRARVAEVISKAMEYAADESNVFNRERNGLLLRRLCDIPPTKDESTDADALIKNFALAKGEGWILAGEPGAGKSSFLLQFALFAGAGKPFFGFDFTRPLRVFYLQTELQNRKLKLSDNSLQYAARTTFEWTDEEFELANENVFYDEYMIGNVCGDIVPYLVKVYATFPFDLLLLDPLLTFAKDDLSLAKQTAEFLYANMTSVMGGRKYRTPDGAPVKFGAIIAHHTGKPRTENGKKIERGQYATAGSYVINAWARFQLNLTRYAGDVYELLAAKNPECCTWRDESGNYTDKIFIKRAARGERYWTRATDAEAEAAKNNTPQTQPETEDERKRREETELRTAQAEIITYLQHLPEPISKSKIYDWCRRNESAVFKGFNSHTAKNPKTGENYPKRPCYLAYELIIGSPLQFGVGYHIGKYGNGKAYALYGGVAPLAGGAPTERTPHETATDADDPGTVDLSGIF